MRRFFYLIAVLAGIFLCGCSKQTGSELEPVTLPLVMDAPFMMDYDLLPEASHDLTVHMVAKGTKAEILGWVKNETELKVVLEDGSVGYMPAIAFAFEKGAKFVKEDIEPDNYSLRSIGPWHDENGTISLRPEYYDVCSEGGYERKLATSGYGNDVHYNYDGRLNQWLLLDDFYEKHPSIDTNLVLGSPSLTAYTLKKDKLPTNFLGYSRSYIESIFGEPHSTVGPELSQFVGYSYSYYPRIRWEMDGENSDEKGLFVFYDKDMRAVHMEKRVIDTLFTKNWQWLLQPFSSNADDDIKLAGAIASNPSKEIKLVTGNGVQPIQGEEITPGSFTILIQTLWYSPIFHVLLTLLVVFVLDLICSRKIKNYGILYTTLHIIGGLIISLMFWQLFHLPSVYLSVENGIRWFIWLWGDGKILQFLMVIVLTIAYIMFWRHVLLKTVCRMGPNLLIMILAICLSISYIKGVYLATEGSFLFAVLCSFVGILGLIRVISIINVYRCNCCYKMNDDTFIGSSTSSWRETSDYETTDTKVYEDSYSVTKKTVTEEGKKIKDIKRFIDARRCSRCGYEWNTYTQLSSTHRTPERTTTETEKWSW